MENKRIEISTLSIIKIVLVILGVIFLYYVRDIIIMLFVVMIIVEALFPMVTWAEHYKIPRWLSALIFYFLIIGAFGLLITLIIPPLVNQVSSFANNFPSYVDKLTPLYQQYSGKVTNWQDIINTISHEIGNIGASFYKFSTWIFGGIATALTTLILSYYLLLEREDFKQYLLNVTSKDVRKKEVIIGMINKVGLKMGAWLRGQISISSIIGVSTMIILSLLGNPYALTIGIIGALVEVIPIIGPVITGTLAVITTFIVGGWVYAAIALGAFILVQQLESQFLVPKIMGKAVELSPFIIIVALLIGGHLAGIPGAILAIPAAAGISVIIQEWPKFKEKEMKK